MSLNPKIGSKNFTFDALLVLEDGAAAVTASGAGQKDGSDAVVDVGSGQLRDSAWMIDVTAADFADADETYVLTLEGSTDAAFTTPVVLATQEITQVGRNVKDIDNVVNEVIYPHVRSYATVGGTTPSITYNSRLGRRVT